MIKTKELTIEEKAEKEFRNHLYELMVQHGATGNIYAATFKAWEKACNVFKQLNKEQWQRIAN